MNVIPFYIKLIKCEKREKIIMLKYAILHTAE